MGSSPVAQAEFEPADGGRRGKSDGDGCAGFGIHSAVVHQMGGSRPRHH